MTENATRFTVLKILLFTLLCNVFVSLTRYELNVKRNNFSFNERQIKRKGYVKHSGPEMLQAQETVWLALAGSPCIPSTVTVYTDVCILGK
jgi:hypothetical protein